MDKIERAKILSYVPLVGVSDYGTSDRVAHFALGRLPGEVSNGDFGDKNVVLLGCLL